MRASFWRTSSVIGGLALGLLILTRLISELSFWLAEPLYHQWRRLDPDNSFLMIALHHLWQGSIALLVIIAIARSYRVNLNTFGFNTNGWRDTLRLVALFCLGWFVIQASIGVTFIVVSDLSTALPFPFTTRNIAGYLAFQLLLSGSSEEILFRALVMPPLLWYGSHSGLSTRTTRLLAGGIATVIFMLAHINIAFDPLRITHCNLLQQLTCLIFGTCYAWLFTRTGSLLGPILAHNLLNGVIVTTGIGLWVLFG